MAERLGFRAVYLSGGALSAAAGVPDVGLLTLTEFVEEARRIAAATPLPLLCDADTGFGDALNVERTVRLFEQAGAAGIHLEDQILPKRCGHLSGKGLVEPEAMAAKVRAAVAARRDADFVIIARTDARGVSGFEDAVRRAKLYLAAGADAIFPEALESPAEFERFAREVPCPLLANMTEFGRGELLDVPTLGKLGYKMVLFPLTAFRAALLAARDVLTAIAATGTQRNFVPRMLTRLGPVRPARLYRLRGPRPGLLRQPLVTLPGTCLMRSTRLLALIGGCLAALAAGVPASRSDDKPSKPVEPPPIKLDGLDSPLRPADPAAPPRSVEVPSVPKTPDPLDAFNDGCRKHYAAARTALLAASGPVVWTDSDRLVLTHKGKREEAAVLPPVYHQLKSVSHAALGVFAVLDAGSGKPPGDETRKAAAELCDLAIAARNAVEKYDFDAVQLKRQRDILHAAIDSLGAAAKGKTPDADARKELTANLRKLVMANAADAAKLQIDGCRKQVEAWKKLVGDEEWKNLKVVVSGSAMPRKGHIAVQFFAWLLKVEGEGDRIVYAEAVWDEEKALRLLGTHLIDGKLAETFFGDPKRMHRDLLADAAAEYLKSLDGREALPPLPR